MTETTWGKVASAPRTSAERCEPEPGHESLCITSRSGARLHLRKWGTGTPSCLLVHGHGEASHVWTQLVPYLPGFTVFAIDLGGHGDSAWESAGRYDIGSYVQEVCSALAFLNLTDISLVGHSLGANVAMRVAASTSLVQKLVIVDFGLGFNEATRQHVRAQFRSQLRVYAEVDDYAALLRSAQPLLEPSIAKNLAHAALRRRTSGGFELKCDPALAQEENNIESPEEEIMAILGTIQCPTLVMRGTGSALLSASNAKRVTAAIRGAHLCTIDKAGHAVMLDNPQYFGAAVGRFLQSG